MWPNPQETADLVTLTEEILNGKLSRTSSRAASAITGYKKKVLWFFVLTPLPNALKCYKNLKFCKIHSSVNNLSSTSKTLAIAVKKYAKVDIKVF